MILLVNGFIIYSHCNRILRKNLDIIYDIFLKSLKRIPYLINN
jgi:hypothetical protein